MPHATPLIAIIVGGLVLAFIFGALAFRLRLSPLVGYLLAGVVVGPFTPGYVADQHLANELAELGVILLMFGVGLHFSVKDLMAVRKIAIPGALGQIALAVLLGMGLAHLLGWSLAGGFVFGLALSVASTVVLLRALQERRILDTERGRIAVGWLIVEDLVMVLALVLLPALASNAGGADLAMTLLVTIGKVVAFVAFMLIVGRRLIPWVLHSIAHGGSRELFRLAVLAIALGVAFGAAMLFGVSFALGAFFAGMILAESPLSQRAAEETLPLRDAFAVLFFVSVGMLFNPSILLTDTLPLVATVAIIIFGKSIAAYAIVRAFGRSSKTALTIAASLAQIGEFSFILATLGASLELIPADARNLILAGAIISIMLNPFLFKLIDRLVGKTEPIAEATLKAPSKGHVVLVGYGRVGRIVGESLMGSGERFTVIEAEDDVIDLPDEDKALVITGNAASVDILETAKIADARMLFVAIPESFEAGQIIEQARRLNPGIRIVARAHSEDEVAHLEKMGADLAIMGEREIARRMVEQARAAA
ncbi:YbaL family putative K(+) efflux transporter [Sphingomonas cavernae]|uniref:Kef family K(+) transporter n=1 Tax=Sphingomonas cavernae TaxID=2320861 RepID=A0A418WM59_9SPHN|nr:YbaL family putative K(+) efflux transporter [Sphingomonas cavernae]RJF91093.1 Kef family K(+) transporter [Sphingomonas cavernae]